jgi:N-methylhydantoinase A/oxoprolinase/acetone carboxylase beta subunit
MGKLISIDNGGTLTDVCVIDGAKIHYTKTLTTPYDLSKCFFEGLKKVAKVIYGEERVVDLLSSTDCIRYSTTQGTNALVEKKGQRLGLILSAGVSADVLRGSAAGAEMFSALVGERIGRIDPRLEGDAYDTALVQAVNALTGAGAHRLVVSLTGPSHTQDEARFKRVWLWKFPRHLLGAVPVLFSHDIADDADDARRTWTALFNAFLHPALEGFLYHAEHILRDFKYRHPLLIFRNDGDSARVAKTIALKTYGSGPRGGMEGARALAAHYGLERLLSLDVGGTTTDIGLVEDNTIRGKRRGEAEGIPISFPLSDIVSIGVGGSSIITARRGEVAVGPESVGAAPGPACFGLGGTQATITDVFLLQGVLDPGSFFGGDLALDTERAERAVRRNVAEPLGLGIESALAAMQRAWVQKIAGAIAAYTQITPATTLAAFGGAGPLEVCRIAEQIGIQRIIIPGLAAVFSAFGIGFSNIAQHYEARLREPTDAALAEALDGLMERARKDMFAEGFELAECERQVHLLGACDGEETAVPLHGEVVLPPGVRARDGLAVSLRVVKLLDHARFGSAATAEGRAVPSGVRHVLSEAGWRELPVFRVDAQRRGATGAGPAIIEEAFFTCRVPAGWRFEFNASADIVLRKVGNRGDA